MSIKALLGVRTRLRRAVTIVDAEQLGGAVMEQLAALFDEAGPERMPQFERHGARRRA